MEKEKIISALQEKGDDYGRIDFGGFRRRMHDAMEARGVKKQKELAAILGVSEKWISQLANECKQWGKPKDGTLERFFRQIDIIALALDVSPIWLKYGIGEMENNAISLDETKKNTAAAGEDSATRAPIRADLDIEDIARSISSVALSMPKLLCALSLETTKDDEPHLILDLTLTPKRTQPLFKSSRTERLYEDARHDFAFYYKDYFSKFNSLLAARDVLTEQEISEKLETLCYERFHKYTVYRLRKAIFAMKKRCADVPNEEKLLDEMYEETYLELRKTTLHLNPDGTLRQAL